MFNLKEIKRIHFIGIGGIGMSALARMMKKQGKLVSGSDLDKTDLLKNLEKEGIKIFPSHNAKNISDNIDLVVYTIAVDSKNSELKTAQEKDIKTLSYPEMLGVVSENKKSIAVSGTHGKTTTSAMIAKVLIDAGLSPTVIVGSLLKEFKSNFVSGNSDLFVVEACEYRRSFLNLKPFIGVITNIEEDHLDYYSGLGDIEDAFGSFVEKIPENGFLICNLKDPVVNRVSEKAKCKVVDYNPFLKEPINLKVPGDHNKQNAAACLAMASVLEIDVKETLSSLSEFVGTWRRFEYKGESKNEAKVYDDYAHHPTEIKETLKAAKSLFPDKKIMAVFQPHLYSRTKQLLNDFAKSFECAHTVVVAPIYAAREKEDKTINEKILSEEINKHHKNVVSRSTLEGVTDFIKRNSSRETVIITLGAGDIYRVAEALVVK